MPPMFEPIVNEFRQEAATTKRVFERIPEDKLSWKPHQKSMSLGQLAFHIASVPGRIAQSLQQNQFEAPANGFDPPQPKSVKEIQDAFEQSCKTAEEWLHGMSEQSARENWSLIVRGKQVFNQPRINVVRSIMMNHCYHHRGQLSVYLRLLDVPVPSVYGPSADENPFA